MQRLNDLIKQTDNINNLDKPITKQPKQSKQNIQSRVDRINYLIDQTDNVNNVSQFKKISLEESDRIKNKFKELKSYVLAKPKDLKKNSIIRYYNLSEPDKISISGTITEIEYYSIINNNNIKTIHLYNRWTEPTTSWAITYTDNYVIYIKKFSLSKGERLIMDLFYTNYTNTLKN